MIFRKLVCCCCDPARVHKLFIMYIGTSINIILLHKYLSYITLQSLYLQRFVRDPIIIIFMDITYVYIGTYIYSRVSITRISKNKLQLVCANRVWLGGGGLAPLLSLHPSHPPHIFYSYIKIWCGGAYRFPDALIAICSGLVANCCDPFD